MPVYKEHHVKYSYGWAKESGTPVQAAGRLIDTWNKNLEEGELPYARTSAFIRSLGTLIFIQRNGMDIQTIPNSDKDGFNVDPLCLSCRKCQ